VDIIYRRKSPRTWIVEVWSEELKEIIATTYPEETYVEINEWCKETFGYHARTSYHVFELHKKAHLDWFLLRWS
jgi:hypothetical protein